MMNNIRLGLGILKRPMKASKNFEFMYMYFAWAKCGPPHYAKSHYTY
jgi:hypothetical protein